MTKTDTTSAMREALVKALYEYITRANGEPFGAIDLAAVAMRVISAPSQADTMRGALVKVREHFVEVDRGDPRVKYKTWIAEVDAVLAALTAPAQAPEKKPGDDICMNGRLFLRELAETMGVIDVCADPNEVIPISEVMPKMLARAREDRERWHTAPAQADIHATTEATFEGILQAIMDEAISDPTPSRVDEKEMWEMLRLTEEHFSGCLGREERAIALAFGRALMEKCNG